MLPTAMKTFPCSVSESNRLCEDVLFPNSLLMSAYAECNLCRRLIGLRQSDSCGKTQLSCSTLSEAFTVFMKPSVVTNVMQGRKWCT